MELTGVKDDLKISKLTRRRVVPLHKKTGKSQISVKRSKFSFRHIQLKVLTGNPYAEV